MQIEQIINKILSTLPSISKFTVRKEVVETAYRNHNYYLTDVEQLYNNLDRSDISQIVERLNHYPYVDEFTTASA